MPVANVNDIIGFAVIDSKLIGGDCNKLKGASTGYESKNGKLSTYLILLKEDGTPIHIKEKDAIDSISKNEADKILFKGYSAEVDRVRRR